MGILLPVLTYHYITFKHFQPWSAIGLQQGMYHIIKFVLLRSRNAIPVVLSEEKRKFYCGVNNGPQPKTFIWGGGEILNTGFPIQLSFW